MTPPIESTITIVMTVDNVYDIDKTKGQYSDPVHIHLWDSDIRASIYHLSDDYYDQFKLLRYWSPGSCRIKLHYVPNTGILRRSTSQYRIFNLHVTCGDKNVLRERENQQFDSDGTYDVGNFSDDLLDDAGAIVNLRKITLKFHITAW